MAERRKKIGKAGVQNKAKSKMHEEIQNQILDYMADKNAIPKLSAKIAALKRSRRARENADKVVTADFVKDNVEQTGLDDQGYNYASRKAEEKEDRQCARLQRATSAKVRKEQQDEYKRKLDAFNLIKWDLIREKRAQHEEAIAQRQLRRK